MKKTIKLSIVAMVTIAIFIIYSCSTDSLSGEEQVTKVESKESISSNISNQLSNEEVKGFESMLTTGLCESADTDCSGPYQEVIYDIPEGTSSYPDCEFWISMKVRYCGDKVDLIYVGFGAIVADSDCDQFWIDVQNPLISEYVMEATELELIKAATIRAVFLSPDGLGIPICGINPSKVVNLSRAACNKYCVTFGGKDGYRVFPLPCGDACCLSTNEVCVDPESGYVIIKEISSLSPATPCKENITFGCPKGTVFTTPCKTRCVSIAQGG